MTNGSIRYKLLSGFDDPSVSTNQWNDLLTKGSGDVIFMTWHWQKTWWDVFGRGQLILISAEQEDKFVAIAPFFSEHGMIYFIGSGGSDYLDFIGDINEEVLEGLLSFASQQVTNFSGFQFYHIPEKSPTNSLLQAVSKKLKFEIIDAGGWPCPTLEIENNIDAAIEATNKKSLLRHEAYFKKNGALEIVHLHKKEDIIPYLNFFFEQHISRWATTNYQSMFLDEKQKTFFIRLTENLSDTAWIRFTRVGWNDKIIAFHFGFYYKGSFLWYKPTFDITLAKHSPGEVLLRQLLLKALEEKAKTFDFGLGDEAFKQRFASHITHVKNWEIYPSANNLQHEEHISYQSAP